MAFWGAVFKKPLFHIRHAGFDFLGDSAIMLPGAKGDKWR
jgi:hypothetical protein